MRNKIGTTLVLICGLLTPGDRDADAQSKAGAEFVVDPAFRFPLEPANASGKAMSIEVPKVLYASKPLKKAELQRLLKDYDPEKSSVKLYGYYTLTFTGAAKKPQKIRVPYYTFQDAGTTYALDSILTSGDTTTLRFNVPASQGHGYELSLGAKSSKIYGLRYLGQGGAGNFTLCRDYAGKPLGTPVVLNHIHPGGTCFDLTPEYEETHFLGRGISPTNRMQLIVVDEKFRTVNSYQLRYKIRGIESGSEFYVTFDDPKLSAEASEVKVAEVIGGKRWRK